MSEPNIRTTRVTVEPIRAERPLIGERAKSEQGWRCPKCGAKIKASMTPAEHGNLECSK